MAVSLYFGLPGCGKTTLLTKLALDGVKDPRYTNVYGNVPLKVFGYTYIDNDCIGKYVLENALILIDEASLYADNRDHKNFTKQQVIYFLMHRHYNVDIVLFTQQWDGVDRKIRVITDRCYYVYKPLFFGLWYTKYYRVPYGIIIPDPKKNSEKLGEIVQGYCKPNIFIRLFAPSIYRPKYYSFFDSWVRPEGFDPLPRKYKPYFETTEDGVIIDSDRAALAYHKAKVKAKSSAFLRSLRGHDPLPRRYISYFEISEDGDYINSNRAAASYRRSKLKSKRFVFFRSIPSRFSFFFSSFFSRIRNSLKSSADSQD